MTGSVVRLLLDERQRWPLWLPVGFGLGIGVYFALPAEPTLWTGPATAAACTSATWFARRRAILWIPLAVVALAAGGVGAAGVRAALVAAPILTAEHGPATVEGVVRAVEPRADGHRALIKVHDISGLAPSRQPNRVRITVRTGAPVPPGQGISVRAVLMPPPAAAAPGGFDFARNLYFQGIGAVGYAVGAPRNTASVPANRFGAGLAALRLAIAERIEGVLTAPREGADSRTQRARVAVALLTGLRGGIDQTVLGWLRDAGLAHLLAISGLHLGLVAGFAFFVVRLALSLVEAAALRRPIKKWAAAAALAAAFGYLLLTGATVPTQRAFIMVALVLAAIMADREPITMRPVAWAALAVLLWRPESLVGASFQMSFGAVTALVAFYEYVAGRAPRHAPPPLWRRPALYIGALVATTIIASLATAPFAAYHFNRVPLVGLVANLAAVPITALWVMPAGLVALLLMPAGLEGPALEVMSRGIGAVITVARMGAALPFAVTPAPAMPPSALAAMVLGGLWLALWRTRWRLWGVAGIAAGMMVAAAARGPDLLVDGDGRLFALRGETGALALSSRRVSRFAANNWLRRAGQVESAAWPPERTQCDRLACIHEPAGGPRVALVTDPRALAEDCAWAELVVSPVSAPGDCAAPLVIDGAALRRHGAHAVWFRAGGGAVVKRARSADRPWVPARAAGDGVQ